MTRRFCCPLWGVEEEFNEGVMVEMVTTLLMLKISQPTCHYCHYLLEVCSFVNNLSTFLMKGFKAKNNNNMDFESGEMEAWT